MASPEILCLNLTIDNSSKIFSLYCPQHHKALNRHLLKQTINKMEIKKNYPKQKFVINLTLELLALARS